MQNIQTPRLRLRPLVVDDAAFIFELVTDPDWLTYIGDKGVHTIDDAKDYITKGPQAMYKQYGIGLMVVELLGDNSPLGLCGLLQRANLTMPDIGFAFLKEARGQGYAFEAAAALIAHTFQFIQLDCLAAITAQKNAASQALLKKLGFSFKSIHHMDEHDPGSHLYELAKTTWLKTP